MGALKRSNREGSVASARSSLPADDPDTGPRSGVRAKRVRSTPPRARSEAQPTRPSTRGGATTRTRTRSSQRGTSTRVDEFAFLEPDVVSALDWGDAESFAEEFIASATGAEAVNEEARDEVVVEEVGGPFVNVPGESMPLAAVDWFGEEEPLG